MYCKGGNLAMEQVSPSDRDVAIRTIVGEASNQGAEGMVAVAWVIRNRAEWSPAAWWGDSVGSVCRKAWQFSAWNGGPNTDRINALQITDHEYLSAASIFDAVFNGDIPDPTNGATTYKVCGTKASWDVAVADTPPCELGQHLFWRLDPKGPVLAFLSDTPEQVVT